MENFVRIENEIGGEDEDGDEEGYPTPSHLVDISRPNFKEMKP